MKNSINDNIHRHDRSRDSIREQVLDELDAYWSDRMTTLVDQNRIADADALFSEYVIDGDEPSNWLFMEEN